MLKIIFEFVGGPNDGKVLNGALGDASDAERYYLFTNHGTIGQRLKVASEYAVETLATVIGTGKERLMARKSRFCKKLPFTTLLRRQPRWDCSVAKDERCERQFYPRSIIYSLSVSWG